MKTTAWILTAYAALITIGGIIGHLLAGSLSSLVMGIIFGLLLFLAAYLCFKKKESGPLLALLLTFLLDGFFTYRFVKTHAFFPAGFLSLLSLAIMLYLALSIRKRSQKR